MKKSEIQLGFIYNVDGNVERAESVYCRGGDFYVNNKRFFSPAELTDSLFDFFGFKFYNGWYHPDDDRLDRLVFLKVSNGYIVSLGTSEIDGLIIQYVHEMQRLLFSVKGIEI